MDTLSALSEDPELAQTMVQLLYDKLQQKRRELDDLRRVAKTTEVQNLADQIESCKTDYKHLKKENAELQIAFSATEVTYDDARTKLQVLLGRIKALENELESTASESFDFSAFLEASPHQSGLLPPFSAIKPLARANRLPQAIRDRFGTVNLLVIKKEDALWIEDEIERTILLAPSFVYVPSDRQGKGVWKAREINGLLKKDQGRYSDIICKTSGAYYYLGRFECLHFSPVSLETASGFSAQAARRAVDATVTSPEEVAPVVSRLVDDMYRDGVLSLEYFALQRCSFDHVTATALEV
ncbi:hypothetical protein BV20DRAFT_1118312 [Pilatotrama ljubarskyi]|nr:hypothetical protein BV20DRAFT_1118312 [Pilatotrama ljubarskyi]